MFGRYEPDQEDRVPVWLWAAAAAAGASAVAFAVLRFARRQRERGPASELDLLEEAAVERLRRDAVTGRAAIDVSALAPGIIELTGTVPSHETGQRAGRLLHALPGVHTVINRLDARSEEQQLAAARARHAHAASNSQTRSANDYVPDVETERAASSPDAEE
jgi:hypothetical protein